MASLSDALAAELGAADPSEALSLRSVRRSDCFDRIDALPRRDAWAQASALVRSLTARLRRKGGTMTLRPAQALALAELADSGKLFAPIGAGAGKTLLTQLSAVVARASRVVVLLPVGLRAQWLRDLEHNARHWTIDPSVFTVVPYSELSTKRGADAIERAAPSLIVADEAHNLRHATSARTKRVARYLDEHPSCGFIPLSGTLTARSIRDYAHLAKWALGEGSPLPVWPRTLAEWAEALDEGVDPSARRAPGILSRWQRQGETVREAYRARVVESPGVIATSESALGTGLELYSVEFSCPLITAALARARVDSYGDPLELARLQRELACGFRYSFAWPDNKPDMAWLTARAAWHGAVAEFLERWAHAGLDSPGLVADACARAADGLGAWPSPATRAAWADWSSERFKRAPPRRTTHVSAECAEFVSRWVAALDGAPALVWVEHEAAGRAIAARLGCEWFGEGADPGALEAPRTLVASIKAHGTGRNLQAWADNLVVSPPASGAVWEQLLARTHRPGQLADTVRVSVAQAFAWQRTAFARAQRDARYIEETTGQVQKLGLATLVGFAGSEA